MAKDEIEIEGSGWVVKRVAQLANEPLAYVLDFTALAALRVIALNQRNFDGLERYRAK